VKEKACSPEGKGKARSGGGNGEISSRTFSFLKSRREGREARRLVLRRRKERGKKAP